MIKIADAFQNGKAFIPFLTCGDPDLETTEALVKAMAEAGADLIELGIPFSDPTAEGPVIQAATCARSKPELPQTRYLSWCESCARPSPSLWCS